MNNSLYGKSEQEIQSILNLDKKYQAKQIKQWLIKGVFNFDDMTNLSKNLRERLKDKQTISSKIIKKQYDKTSNTYKLAIKLSDKRIVECVLLNDNKDNHTACLSSQVGCAMGCKFCKTGTMGLLRNLKDYEIIEQFVYLNNIKKLNHIVFMGMGEPLANLDNVLKASDYIHNSNNYDLSYRRITISTCGLASSIIKLSEQPRPIRLAISLVSSNNNQRNSLMPINKSFNLDKLKKSLIIYQNKFKKRITLEYCLLKDVNTSFESAKELKNFTKNLKSIVNLIPWNPVDDLKFEKPSDKEIQNFCSYLNKLNIDYTIRYEKGSNIDGACGQLASSVN